MRGIKERNQNAISEREPPSPDKPVKHGRKTAWSQTDAARTATAKPNLAAPENRRDFSEIPIPEKEEEK